MLNEDPHIARRMQEFLSLISQPPPLALTAQLIMQSLERLVRTGSPTLREAILIGL
jgi:son of sevenless-like protein